MPAEKFRCPHCRVQLTKSPAAYVLGEMQRGAVMGSQPKTTTCPGCGKDIDAEKMIKGEYDDKPMSGYGWLFVIVGLMFVAWLVSR